MNKAVFALALVAAACLALAALAEANKLPHRKSHFRDQEHFEHEGGELEHKHHGHHEDENEGHGHEHEHDHNQVDKHHQHHHKGGKHHHHKHQHPGKHHHHKGKHHGGHLKHHHKHQHHGKHHNHKGKHHHGHHHDNEHDHEHHQHGGKHHGGFKGHKRFPNHGAAGFGGGVIGGAAGGFKEHDGHRVGFENQKHIGDHKSIEGKNNFVAGENKGFEADLHHGQEDEQSGIHKHQVVNKNKVFLKDQTSAVNDVDGFHNRQSENDSAHFGAHDNKIIGGGSSEKFTHDNEFDTDFKAGASGEHDIEAGGAIGGAAAGFAGEVF